MRKRLTTKQFIEKCQHVHGDRYDYSLVLYETIHRKVSIGCHQHGVFKQTPGSHLQGYGCPKCGFNREGLTIELFVHRSRLVHDDKYTYELVRYKTNHEKVILTCRIHGEFDQTPNDHLQGYGCPKCGILKRKQTMLERYGVEHALQSEQFQTKQKQTMLKRYGVEHPIQNKQIQAKTKQTIQEKYQVEYTFQSKQIQAKTKQTNLKRYGSEHSFNNKQIQLKQKQTMLKRYGVDNPSKSNIIKEQIKQTHLKRYNGKHFHQQHLSQQCLQTIHDPLWLYIQHHRFKKPLIQIANELGIGDTTLGRYFNKHKIQVLKNNFSYKAIRWLENIMETENILIQHAQNGGEYTIPGTRIRVDGWCQNTNTVYEFYGDVFHGNPDRYTPNYVTFLYKTAGELYEATQRREQQILSKGYNLVTIWESKFMLTYAI